ncbi:FtsH protease activity modulator HflK [Lachnoclostridium phytofermentans]|uniref:Protein HflK n=1 Tax=Lachnoclostridium phytofermentans (strain ATCC 700394 / DSM 18823 / ISDg) TaxID=357809 RepID=A9KL20_LACP7|nr:FtsH protease activity modulator HflK [Lachnoclostridium phytofermentans]ABX44169.1 HflK protein [Lachnoclostridium phytofermentans ISDg]
MDEKQINAMKKGSKVAVIAIVIIVIAILGGMSAYSINEQEQAVVTTFGIPKQVDQPGLHFKIPFIQKVKMVDTTIKGFTIGYDLNTGESIDEEALMITVDYNFVLVDFFVEYKVTDPVKYLYASNDPASILKNLAQSCIRSQVGSYDVDSVITTGKNEIQSVIRDMITEKLIENDLGISLVNLTIQDAEPPTSEVMEAFKAVETAKQGKETAINNANKYRNEELPAAEAQIDQITKEAESAKQARINEAEGQVARFNAIYQEYKKYPLITKQRMFYEAMEDILPDLKVIIDNSKDGVQKLLPIEPLIGGGQ